MGKKLSIIRRWIKESVDLEWYDRLFALQLFMSGDREVIRRAQNGKYLRQSMSDTNNGELPDYAEIIPAMGETGTQNHGLINARINVQGLSMEPEFLFQHQDPIVRQVNEAYIRDRWQTQRWDEEFFIGGMEIEANGITSFHVGIDDNRVNIKHFPILDTLFDRSHKSPSQWKWVCVRDRLTPEEALEIYGDAIDKDDVTYLTTQENLQSYTVHLEGAGRNVRPLQIIVEWSYYDRDDHIVFLGSINGAKSIPLKLGSDSTYRKIRGNDDTATAGPNPFGCIPHAFWVDFWAPSVRRPIAKMETTMRLASMLNEVESYMVNTLREGVPITAIDTSNISRPEVIEEIMAARSAGDIKRLIVMDGNVREALHRTDPAEIPQVVLHLRGMLKEEINAATGVGDMERGQALGGERKTREEIQNLADASGIQARHFKRRFGHCVEDIVGIVRVIGAQFDTARQLLNLDDYDPIDTALIPLKPFLTEYLPCQVLADSLGFKTDDDRKQEALAEFTQVHLPYINLGVMDAMKSMVRTLKKFGYMNPAMDLGKDPAPLAAPGGAPPGAMPPGGATMGPGGPAGAPPMAEPPPQPSSNMGHLPLAAKVSSSASLPNQ